MRSNRSVEHTTLRTLMLAAVAWAAAAGAAQALVPPIVVVTATSPSNSTSTKMAVAQCAFGSTVLGGGASTTGASGQVVIQGAFPMFDPGLGRHVFVAKASESDAGSPLSWSVTATAFCTVSNFTQRVVALSAYDSDPIKSVTVACPAWTRVVGMGGEVSRQAYDPDRLLSTLPPAAVVFQGFGVNEDLTAVTAKATEVGAAIDKNPFAGPWQVAAVAYCVQPAYYNGLSMRSNVASTGAIGTADESYASVTCLDGQRLIATGATVNDSDMGQWYLNWASPASAAKPTAVAMATRNSGAIGITQAVYGICIDK